MWKVWVQKQLVSVPMASRADAVRLTSLTALLMPAAMVAHAWKALAQLSHACALLTTLALTAVLKSSSVLPKHASMEEHAKRVQVQPSRAIARMDTRETCAETTTQTIKPVLRIPARMAVHAAKTLVRHSLAAVPVGSETLTAL